LEYNQIEKRFRPTCSPLVYPACPELRRERMRRATRHCFSKKCFESTGIPGAEDPLLQDRPTRRFPVNINPAATYRNPRSDEDGYPERLLFPRSRDRRSPNGCFDHVLKQAQRVEELLFPLTPISQGLGWHRRQILRRIWVPHTAVLRVRV